MLESIILHVIVYAWGSCLLAMLYYQLYFFIYRGTQPIGCGVTLLQVWYLEHIAMCRLVVEKCIDLGLSYVLFYVKAMTQQWVDHDTILNF